MKVAPVSAVTPRHIVTPPIPLIKPEEAAYKTGQYTTLKLRSSPADRNSPVHEIQVPFFKDGTCEQFFEFLDKVRMVFIGQHLQQPAQMFAFVRTVLKGDALAHFTQAAISAGAETADNYVLCVRSLTTHVFPQRALRIQKRYMRRYMRKPRDMRMRVFRSRVVELNNYLDRFPAGFEDQKLDDEEVLDILEFATPNGWQREMVRQGFDASQATDQDLVEFCERLEFYENGNTPGPSAKVGQNADYKPAAASTWQAGKRSTRNEGPNQFKQLKRYKRENGQRNPGGNFAPQQPPRGGAGGSFGFDPEKYCMLHKQWGHDLNNCKYAVREMTKIRNQWETVPGLKPWRGGPDERRNSSANKKNGSSELKTMVESAVKQQLSAKRKSVDFHMLEKQIAEDGDDKGDEMDEFVDAMGDDFEHVKLTDGLESDTE
jgi:hypothetical protein